MAAVVLRRLDDDEGRDLTPFKGQLTNNQMSDVSTDVVEDITHGSTR